MVSEELMGLLRQVIQSWQVIVITIVIVLYLSLVCYVARTYHRPRSVSKSKPKTQKKKVEAAPVEPADAAADDEPVQE
jgi:hypothetical protein